VEPRNFFQKKMKFRGCVATHNRNWREGHHPKLLSELGAGRHGRRYGGNLSRGNKKEIKKKLGIRSLVHKTWVSPLLTKSGSSHWKSSRREAGEGKVSQILSREIPQKIVCKSWTAKGGPESLPGAGRRTKTAPGGRRKKAYYDLGFLGFNSRCGVKEIKRPSTES